MTESRWIVCIKCAAALLLLFVMQRGWRLYELSGFDQALSGFEEDASKPETAVSVWKDLSDWNVERLAQSQLRRRLSVLRRAATVLLADHVTLRLADETPVRFDQAKPFGCRDENSVFVVRIDSNSPLFGELTAVKVGADRYRLESGSARIEARLAAESPFRGLDFAFVTEGGLTVPEPPLHLDIVLDRDAPRIRWSGGVARPSMAGSGSDDLRVRPNEALEFEVLNASRLRRVTARLDGTQLFDLENGSTTHRIAHGLNSFDESRELEVEVEDSAGNRLEASYTLRRWRKPLPRLHAMQVNGRSAPLGTIVTKAPEIDLLLEIPDLDEDARPVLVLDGKKTPLLGAGGDSYQARLIIGDRPQELRGRGKLVATIGGRETTVHEFDLISDPVPPRAHLFDEEGRLVLGKPIELAGESRFELVVRDQDRLKSEQVETKRSGGVILADPVVKDGVYRRRITVTKSGSLEVEARDSMNNPSVTSFEFKIKEPPEPDDGKGPRVRLISKDVELGSDRELVFWQEAAGLSLVIEDPNDLSLVDLELGGAVVGGARDQAPSTSFGRRFELPITVTGSFTVDVKDRFGNPTSRPYSITIVETAPELLRFDGVTVEPNGEPIEVTRLPVSFTLGLATELPEGYDALAVDESGGEVAIPLQGRHGKIPPGALANGAWTLRIRLEAVNGRPTFIDRMLVVKLP